MKEQVRMNPTESVRNWFGINREPLKKAVGVGTAGTGRDWAEPKEKADDDLGMAQTLVAAWPGAGGEDPADTQSDSLPSALLRWSVL